MREKLFLLVSTAVVSVVTALGVVASPVYAAGCDRTFFGIPPWYNGLTDPANCQVKQPNKDDPNGMRSFIVKIALNIAQAAMVIVGYITIFFLIKGGFLYITAQGEPGHITAAKQTITNAIIGLIVSLLAAAIVGAISGAIKV